MKLCEITRWLETEGYGYKFIGDAEVNVEGFASLNTCEPGKITWVKKQENYHKLEDQTGVTVAVVQEGLNLDIPNQIVSSHSKEVFFAILHHFWGNKKQHGFVGTGTFISPEAEIDPTAYIGYNCSIVGEVMIGANTVIENNVVIQGRVRIGEECIIHSGTVIGKDGFGFSFGEENIPIKVEHFGGVLIGNRVEIGANCTVDRGTIDNTIIGDDTKIDSLVIIAHNVIIGKGVLIIGCAAIGGSVTIGDKSYIAPRVVVKNQSSIGSNSFVGMGAVVNKPIEDNMMVLSSEKSTISNNRNYRRFL